MPPANVTDRGGSLSVGERGKHSALQPRKANLKKTGPSVSIKDSPGAETVHYRVAG